MISRYWKKKPNHTGACGKGTPEADKGDEESPFSVSGPEE